MGVHVQGHLYLTMPEYLLHHFEVYAHTPKEGGCRMPQIVNMHWR